MSLVGDSSLGDGGAAGAASTARAARIASRYGVVGITGRDFPAEAPFDASSPGRSHTASSSVRGLSAKKCAESSAPTAASLVVSERRSSRSKRSRSKRSLSPAADIFTPRAPVRARRGVL
jgi:hypothetical protein